MPMAVSDIPTESVASVVQIALIEPVTPMAPAEPVTPIVPVVPENIAYSGLFLVANGLCKVPGPLAENKFAN